MRRLLGRRPGVCTTCDADLVRGASWCGACGAAVLANDEEHAAPQAAVPDAPPPPPEPSARRRLGVVLLVVVVLGALVVAGFSRTPPPVALLGTPAAASGMSATGPPPDGLRVAWRHGLGVDGGMGYSTGGAVQVTADEDRVAVDGRVVDRASGRMVRLDDRGTGRQLWADGDALLRTDLLTGEVEVVGALPTDDLGYPSALLGDVVVLTRDRTVTFVGLDGRELAAVDGHFLNHLDRVAADAAVVPVRGGNGSPESEIRLLDPDTGESFQTLRADRGTHVVDVDGAIVLHAVTSATVGEPGTGVTWSVRVLDGRTGAVEAAADVASAHAPRLLGVLSDGTVVVGARSGSVVLVWLLEPGRRAVDPLLTTRVPTSSLGDPYGHFDGDITSQAVVVGDLVVVLDAEAEAVRAVDAAGREAWRAPAIGIERIGTGDGLVALVHDDSDGQADRGTRVLDGADGSRVVVVPPGTAAYVWSSRPAVAYDGHVAIGDDRGWFGRVEINLVSSRWLDLRDGDLVGAEDVLADLLPDDERLGTSTFLHGFTRAGATGPLPVVTRDLDRNVVQLLEPGVGFATVDLGASSGTEVAGYYAQVVGISPSAVVVSRQDFETGRESSHVIDRATGEVRDLPGVAAIAVVGDVVLAVAQDEGPNVRTGALGLDLADGTERWRVEDATGVLFRDHLLADDRVLASVGRRGVAVLDLADGTTRWSHVPTELLRPTASVLGARRVVVTTTDGDVVALDRADGAEVWRTALDTPVTAITGAGDDVLVGTVDGLVVHLDARGREVQRIAVGTSPVTSVAALGDTVVAVADGDVVGLRTDGDGIVEQDEVDLP